MPIRMIAADLDGTLLRDDKTVSERTQAVLAGCREQGIKVIFATGRSYRTKIVPQEWFDGRVIVNGAYAYIDEKLIYNRRVSSLAADSIRKACVQRGITVESRLDDEIYITELRPGDAEYVRSLLPDDLYLIVLRDSFGQVMHRGATKAQGVAALAAHWGIAQSEVAAFGDDLNDIDLLQWAGCGVAMMNALPDVKAAAGAVTLSNEEDGLAAWVEENVLKRV